MNDQFGREVGVGDKVQLKGTIVGVNDFTPDFVNCFVQLDEGMPPTGARIQLSLNTQQVEMLESSATQRRLGRINQQIGQIKQLVRELYQ